MTATARLLHGVAAAVTWGALALQFLLLADQFAADGANWASALWRFLGYFTILTNGFVAVTATASALAPRHWLAGPRMRLAAVTAILIVGLVYSLALRHVWDPHGWQAVADHALHDATPLLFLLAWWFGPHGQLDWRDTLWALPFGFAYLVYAMARGAVEGWYAYYFLDPSQQTVGELLGVTAAIVAALTAIALLVVATDKLLARRDGGPAMPATS
ncbi:Pr6Pr family membrane protein [Sphingopyxis sp. DHUNG17]|uniref:Pr6Pr family membrane protein n=1 Tax=Sphingopyxis jiangsuensis TaxID=2871171 RepID=UPI00191E26C0|nr:Pr6Pr family membrane protein [Sphingopyxis lutea]MBL0767407.1 Pr6Pr family membrane protein [Sphingopyxis lutea]